MQERRVALMSISKEQDKITKLINSMILVAKEEGWSTKDVSDQ